MPSTERSNLSIVYKHVNALRPYERNARTHSKRQIRQIADSIKEFGFTNPVLINPDNTMVAGHGRVLAAKQMGMSQVPTICLSELTPDQIRAYVIADNRLAEVAGWDESILKIELQHLLTLEGLLDVTVTGFDMPEVDFMIQGDESKSDPDDCVTDHFRGSPVSRLGDLWILRKHPSVNTSSKQSDEGNLLALHPTVKPIALVADALLDSSARGHIVLDAFLGSGTTLMAAERIGRVCHAIELDPLYVDTAIRRWQRYTGDTAVHCETGETFNVLEVKRA
jgi:hypothetical protein